MGLLLLDGRCVRILHIALVWAEGSAPTILHLTGGLGTAANTNATDSSLHLIRKIRLLTGRLGKHLMRKHLLIRLICACGHLVIIIVSSGTRIGIAASFLDHTSRFLRRIRTV